MKFSLVLVSKRSRLAFVAAVLSLLAVPVAVRASNLNVVYYTVANGDKDAYKLCCGVSDNEVLPSLGLNGLPVLNTAMTGAPMPTDIDADGELTYWSPALSNGGPGGTSDVVQTATGLVSLPYTNNAFFTPNGTGSHDGSPNGFQAAYFYGTLDAPTAEKISFSVSSDDMAFVYLDGTVVCNDGGVHGATAVPCTTSTVSAGDHTLQIFYVDLDPVAAVLDFSITTTGVTTSGSAVPEPGTWTLFGTGLLVLLVAARRRRIFYAHSTSRNSSGV
ncbi:MAG: PEP-CTERM sorting domain-containing protein [Terracidiphilus sp.]|jgi:hypothetical protein